LNDSKIINCMELIIFPALIVAIIAGVASPHAKATGVATPTDPNSKAVAPALTY